MNETSKVFLRRVVHGATDSWADAANAVLSASGTLAFVKKNDLVAVKLHVGEPGLKTFLPPEIAAQAVALVRSRGGRPFLTDSAVLYASPRSTGAGHAEVAWRHGFTMERTGAPFLPADGLEGNLERTIEISGKHFRQVGIASCIADADCAVIVTHATGHLASGFGATLKNLGMGCASRKGKLLQHSDTKPKVRQRKCTACGACLDSCPENAIATLPDGTAQINDATCIGCGECIANCRSDAVGFSWDTASSKMQEKMAEHALGTVRSLAGKVACLTGIVNVTRDCDCMASRSEVVARDIGFAVSTDPVALDQAVLDLVERQEGKRLDQLSYPSLDGTIQLAYAETIGLGSRRYELVEV